MEGWKDFASYFSAGDGVGGAADVCWTSVIGVGAYRMHHGRVYRLVAMDRRE